MSTVLLRRVMQRTMMKGKFELFSTNRINPERKISKYTPFHIWENCSPEQMQSITIIKQENYRVDQHNQIFIQNIRMTLLNIVVLFKCSQKQI